MDVEGVTSPRPLVTVVIPVRNGAFHLLRAIKSVERLDVVSDAELQVTVVDDGAELSLREIIRAGNFGLPIHLTTGTQQGPSAARNLGVERSSGDYFIFLDVDDCLTQEWSSALATLAAGGEGLGPPPRHAIRAPSLVLNSISGHQIQWDPSWLPGSYCVSRDAFLSANGFDPSRRWGEHHEMGDRVSALPGTLIRELPRLQPVAIKYNDRAASVIIGYAERRLQASLNTRRAGGLDSIALATSLDVSAVSAARIAKWRQARSFADEAVRTSRTRRRLARSIALRIPLLRSFQYRGILHLKEWRDHHLGLVEARTSALTRYLSLLRELRRAWPSS